MTTIENQEKEHTPVEFKKPRFTVPPPSCPEMLPATVSNPSVTGVAQTPTTAPLQGSEIRLSNADFVATFIPHIPEGASTAICSKLGDPSVGGWYASQAGKVVGGLPVAKNNYLNGSSFFIGADGSFNVRKDNFAACHFVMLDDVGTKVPMEMLNGFTPSWVIETSPGNFQVGIIFSTPITDGAIAERLLNALIAKGLCDKGASGPLTRWARLPGGINGKLKYHDKEGKPFRCKVAAWNPKARYTPEEVATAFNLELAPIIHPSTASVPSVNKPQSVSNPVLSPSIRSTSNSKNQANVKALLDKIDADIEHTFWLHVLMAIHFEFGGSEEGLRLADKWSSKGSKYKGFAEIKNKWSYFKTDKENSFNIGTIINMVKANGIDWMAVCAEAEDPFEPCVIEKVYPGHKSRDESKPVTQGMTAQVAIVAGAAGISTEATVKVDTVAVPVSGGPPIKAAIPFDKFSLRGMSDEIEKSVVAAVPILGELALMGQITVLFAAPNTGKTLITIGELINAIKDGRVDPSKVYYLNMDDSGSSLLEKLRIAEEYGFHMLAEGYRDFSAGQFLGIVRGMIENDQATGVIIILDTLKKFVDLMDKGKTSIFTNVMRPFTTKGGSMIALAHTNKNPGKDGKPVYGGVSDILNDIDCAYTIAQVSAQNGEKVVEFQNIKRRGNVAQSAAYSYSISNGIPYSEIVLSVQPVDDTALEPLKQAEAIKSDAEVVAAVVACINEGVSSKMKLAEATAKLAGISRNAALQVIERYTGSDPASHHWTFSKGARGAMQYALLAAPQQDTNLPLPVIAHATTDLEIEVMSVVPVETNPDLSGSTPAHQYARISAPPVRVGDVWCAGPSGHLSASAPTDPAEGT